MLVEITEKEYKLIMESRKKELDFMIRAEKKRNCEHDFTYKGHGHNFDWYECTKCQESEDR